MTVCFKILIATLQVVAMFGVPALILRYRHTRLIRLFGPIGMAYFWGIAVSFAVWLLNLCGLRVSLISDIGEIGSYAAVGIAIPLLLFGCSLKQVRRLTKPVLISFGTLTVSVVCTSVLVYYLWGRQYDFGSLICAMSVGLYTGGTPNLISIGLSAGADMELITLGNLSDMIVGGVFYVFLLMLAKPLLMKLLGVGKEEHVYLRDSNSTVNVDEFHFHFSFSLLRNLFIAFGCAAVGAGVGILLWVLRGSVQGTMTAYLVPGVMITVTLLGIAFSFVFKVRDVPENASLGQYLILVFSFALSSCLNLGALSVSFLPVFGLLSVITVFSFFLHILLSKLFGIGTDCALVTLTAGLYGPAFVPAITRQLKNDALTAPGLICGSLGYAVGTFLGLLIFLILL